MLGVTNGENVHQFLCSPEQFHCTCCGWDGVGFRLRCLESFLVKNKIGQLKGEIAPNGIMIVCDFAGREYYPKGLEFLWNIWVFSIMTF